MRIAVVSVAGRWQVVDLDTPGRVLSTHNDQTRAMTAGAALWHQRVGAALVAAADDSGALTPPDGGTAFFAAVAFQGVETDDGRLFTELTVRPMPIPLWWQSTQLDGHDGAVIVGRFDTMTLADDQMTWQGTGWYDNSADAAQAIKQAREKTNYGISMDATGSHYPDYECMEYDEEGWCNRERVVYPTALIVSATQVATPAFGLAQISLDAMPEVTPTAAATPPDPPEGVCPDFMDWFFFDAEKIGEPIGQPRTGVEVPADGRVRTITAAGDGGRTVIEADPDCGCDGDQLTAAAVVAPVDPPAAWFDDPLLDALTPMTITDDGRIFGHAAAWDVCHVGFPDSCVTAPRSAAGYSYFHTGELVTAEGVRLAVGTLTMGTGHADVTTGGPTAAVAHYDDTGTQVAHVRVGEDEHGVWMAGAVVPDLAEEDARRLRAAAPSGDWRRIAGNLELVAVLAVNTPGFPTPRAALAASAAGDEQVVEALVAAGSRSLVEMATEPWRAEVAALRVEVATVRAAVQPLMALARARVRADV